MLTAWGLSWSYECVVDFYICRRKYWRINWEKLLNGADRTCDLGGGGGCQGGCRGNHSLVTPAIYKCTNIELFDDALMIKMAKFKLFIIYVVITQRSNFGWWKYFFADNVRCCAVRYIGRSRQLCPSHNRKLGWENLQRDISRARQQRDPAKLIPLFLLWQWPDVFIADLDVLWSLNMNICVIYVIEFSLFKYLGISFV